MISVFKAHNLTKHIINLQTSCHFLHKDLKNLHVIKFTYSTGEILSKHTCGYHISRYNIVSLLLPKAGAKLEKGRINGALLNDLSKPLECILLDLFNVKLHLHSLDSHIQHIGNAHLGRIKAYLGPCQTSVIKLLVKKGNS